MCRCIIRKSIGVVNWIDAVHKIGVYSHWTTMMQSQADHFQCISSYPRAFPKLITLSCRIRFEMVVRLFGFTVWVMCHWYDWLSWCQPSPTHDKRIWCWKSYGSVIHRCDRHSLWNWVNVCQAITMFKLAIRNYGICLRRIRHVSSWYAAALIVFRFSASLMIFHTLQTNVDSGPSILYAAG